MTEILKKHYDTLGPADRREILRYACAGNYSGGEETLSLCESEVSASVCADVLYTFTTFEITGGSVVFPGYTAESASLSKHLDGCDGAVIMFATIGHGTDRIIKKYSSLSPLKSLLCSATGSERVECLCDRFCSDLAAERTDLSFTRRFSPGYGDLNLNMQKYIFGLLAADKNCGAVISDNYFIMPSKTVTAVMGYKKA